MVRVTIDGRLLPTLTCAVQSPSKHVLLLLAADELPVSVATVITADIEDRVDNTFPDTRSR